MGKSDRRRQEERKRKRADRPRGETDANSRRKGTGAAPGKEAVRPHGVSERVAVALSVLALFQCLLIVLLAIVVSFDWLDESGTGRDSLPAGDVAPVNPVNPARSATRSPANPVNPARSATRSLAPGACPHYLSPYEATEFVKQAVSKISRLPADSIGDTQSLRDVDVGAPERVEDMKSLLRLSIEASCKNGSLNISSFMDTLQLTSNNTVASAGERLVNAYQVAWSTD